MIIINLCIYVRFIILFFRCFAPKSISMKQKSFFLFLIFSISYYLCSAQVPTQCYYMSGGRLYTNGSFTSPSGGITAASQCTGGYSGTPYFFSNDSPPVGFFAALGCYFSGGDYYKVACPIDSDIIYLIGISTIAGFFIIKRRITSFGVEIS